MTATDYEPPAAPRSDPFFNRAGLLILVLLFIVGNLYGLSSYPAPWVDEGWIAEVAAVISTGQPPGNPSHGTLYHFNDRLYWMPPLYFYLLGGWFTLFSVDLVNARLLNGLFGLLTLILVFEYGRRRIGPTAAFLAGLVLLCEPFAWKAFRTVRFESLMALAGFALIAALDRTLDRSEPAGRRSLGGWLICGALAGVLVNVHPNAVLFCAGAVAVLLVRGGPAAFRTRGPWTALGVALLLCVPYVLYCLGDAATGFANLKGQNAFHLDTSHGPPMLREWSRYAGFYPWPFRAPAALASLAVLIAAVAGVRHAFTKTMLLPLGVGLTCLLFLPNKTLLYFVPLVPFLALLAADWWRRTRGLRSALAVGVLILSGAAVEGGLLHRNRGCDFRTVFAEIEASLEPGDRIAGTFVTWWAAWPRPFHEFSRGATLTAVEAFRPTVILLGDRQWTQEVPTRFGPLARDLDRELSVRGTLVRNTGDGCIGHISMWRFTE